MEIIWADGDLSGDETAVRTLTETARRMEGFTVASTPTGPFSYSNHLSSSFASLTLMEKLLDCIDDVTGDNPGDLWEPGVIY
ncbi:MAG: hypothetical protein ACQEXQ_07640 [Bacillota bacterium]